jgi:hypothetical protein
VLRGRIDRGVGERVEDAPRTVREPPGPSGSRRYRRSAS